MTHDPRFTTNEARLAHRDELEVVVQYILLERSANEWLQRLEAADVIAGPVYTYPEVFHDPQVLHNQMIVEVDHAALGRMKTHGLPVKLHDTPGQVRRAAPILGQDSTTILREAGYTDDEIRRLAASGVTAPRAVGVGKRGSP
jgi:formyl-CoA transferase